VQTGKTTKVLAFERQYSQKTKERMQFSSPFFPFSKARMQFPKGRMGKTKARMGKTLEFFAFLVTGTPKPSHVFAFLL
jgi:hypothetical protein